MLHQQLGEPSERLNEKEDESYGEEEFDEAGSKIFRDFKEAKSSAVDGNNTTGARNVVKRTMLLKLCMDEKYRHLIFCFQIANWQSEICIGCAKFEIFIVKIVL